MANPKENTFLIVVAFIVIFVMVFGILSFFLRFQIEQFNGVSLAFFFMYVILSVFTLGVLVVQRHNLPSVESLIRNLALINILLAILTLVVSAGTTVSTVVSLTILPFLFLHIVVMIFFVMRSSGSGIDFGTKHKDGPVDRRRYPRIKNYGSVEYLTIYGSWEKARVYDVSGAGVRLIMDRLLDVGKLIELKLFIPYDTRPIFTTGRVVWANELSLPRKEFHIGIEFTNIDPADRLRLTLKQVYSLFPEEKES